MSRDAVTKVMHGDTAELTVGETKLLLEVGLIELERVHLADDGTRTEVYRVTHAGRVLCAREKGRWN